jgi:hypothetical protein
VLARLAPEAARRYHLVVLSDHGQSQGATFRQRYGETLNELVERLSGEQTGDPEAPEPPLLVVSSGNLSLLYLTQFRHRLSLTEINRAYPELVTGLAAHPGVGLVVVRDEDGPVAFGTSGLHRLRNDTVEGVDPLLPYGPYARADLLRHQETAHVGDLVLIGCVDPVTEEVAAFEELVGSHGGLGGWQTDAMLVHPARWPIVRPELNGADAVHHQLVDWLEMLGLRSHQPPVADQQHAPIEAAAAGETTLSGPSRTLAGPPAG